MQQYIHVNEKKNDTISESSIRDQQLIIKSYEHFECESDLHTTFYTHTTFY